MSLIEQIDKWIQERGSAAVLEKHLAFLRDQIASMEARHQREVADLKAEHTKEIAALKEQQTQRQDALPRTQRDSCPHCGQPRGRQVVRRPERPPCGGYVEIYECDGCGERYERHLP